MLQDTVAAVMEGLKEYTFTVLTHLLPAGAVIQTCDNEITSGLL